jgi:hypothetical protein
VSAVLASRQAALHDWLRSGDTAIGAHVATPPQVQADAASRLRIYADGYRLRLVEVLAHDFPVLVQCIGTAGFDVLASRYLREHPSTQPSVRHLGHAFADWLSAQAGVDAGTVEVARFEWAQGEVFDAHDAQPITMLDVASLPMDAWPRLRLSFQPALRRLHLRTAVPPLVQAHAAEHPLPGLTDAAPADWLLWRQDFTVHWRRLADDEADALRHMDDGGSFGELCARLEAGHGDGAPLRAAGLLKRWIHDGLVTALHAAPQGPSAS